MPKQVFDTAHIGGGVDRPKGSGGSPKAVQVNWKSKGLTRPLPNHVIDCPVVHRLPFVGCPKALVHFRSRKAASELRQVPIDSLGHIWQNLIFERSLGLIVLGWNVE